MPLTIETPGPLQVLQRLSAAPGRGAAQVRVSGTGARPGITTAVFRTSLCPGGSEGTPTPETEVAVEIDADGTFRTDAVDLSGGGWYRLEIAIGDEVAVVEPIGVGEVFVVTGQSYAMSCHELVTTVTDPAGRVVAASPEQPGWRHAHDPQPAILTRIDAETQRELLELASTLDRRFPHGPHTPYVGSIWPTFGDHVIELIGVPVALVHAAVAGTRIAQWQPGTQLCTNICDAGTLAGDYRALLWQQGESDAMAGTSTDAYAAQLRKLREAVVATTGVDRPWLLAKSTHHPTGNERRDFEDNVRAAIDQLVTETGFLPGPDTDRLRGDEYRAGWWRGAHFTARGQRAAGLMWASACATLVGTEGR